LPTFPKRMTLLTLFAISVHSLLSSAANSLSQIKIMGACRSGKSTCANVPFTEYLSVSASINGREGCLTSANRVHSPKCEAYRDGMRRRSGKGSRFHVLQSGYLNAFASRMSPCRIASSLNPPNPRSNAFGSGRLKVHRSTPRTSIP